MFGDCYHELDGNYSAPASNKPESEIEFLYDTKRSLKENVSDGLRNIKQNSL